MSEFVMDVERLRKEARAKIEEGALTPHYRANREAVLAMLPGRSRSMRCGSPDGCVSWAAT